MIAVLECLLQHPNPHKTPAALLMDYSKICLVSYLICQVSQTSITQHIEMAQLRGNLSTLAMTVLLSGLSLTKGHKQYGA